MEMRRTLDTRVSKTVAGCLLTAGKQHSYYAVLKSGEPHASVVGISSLQNRSTFWFFESDVDQYQMRTHAHHPAACVHTPCTTTRRSPPPAPPLINALLAPRARIKIP